MDFLGRKNMSRTFLNIEHIRLVVDKSFEAFTASFEQQLGSFDAAVYNELDGGDTQKAQAMLNSMVGPSGFMLFRKSNHGLYLRIKGRPRKAMQYLIGNPLFAIEMTGHAIGAALYAPLRVLLYEIAGSKTCVEYDLPSSLFGQFDDEQVDRVAKSLDQKLDALIAVAALIRSHHEEPVLLETSN
jgi:uncharacterized protein (DUF302 family)